jgi:cell division protein ZapE
MPAYAVSVTKLYEQSLAERGYKADSAQLDGIAALQRCQDEWASYKASEAMP